MGSTVAGTAIPVTVAVNDAPVRVSGAFSAPSFAATTTLLFMHTFLVTLFGPRLANMIYMKVFISTLDSIPSWTMSTFLSGNNVQNVAVTTAEPTEVVIGWW